MKCTVFTLLALVGSAAVAGESHPCFEFSKAAHAQYVAKGTISSGPERLRAIADLANGLVAAGQLTRAEAATSVADFALGYCFGVVDAVEAEQQPPLRREAPRRRTM